jgi:MYXO-CTERM domain-containing protein
LATTGGHPGFTYTQTGGSTTVNGTLTAVASGVSLQGGSLLGAGTINGNVNNSGGSVEPASAPGVPGKLIINGSYTQGPSGTLIIDINGLNSFSLLDVLGAGSLDGNVTFDFNGGFTPPNGQVFTFLTAEAGNLSGVFASDTFNGFGCATCTLDYNYGNGTVALDINGTAPTPEPSAWLMLGTALLAMVAFGMMQRRRAKQA